MLVVDIAAAIAKLVEAKQEGDSVTSSSSCGSAPGSPQFNCSTCGKTFKKVNWGVSVDIKCSV